MLNQLSHLLFLIYYNENYTLNKLIFYDTNDDNVNSNTKSSILQKLQLPWLAIFGSKEYEYKFIPS